MRMRIDPTASHRAAIEANRQATIGQPVPPYNGPVSRTISASAQRQHTAISVLPRQGSVPLPLSLRLWCELMDAAGVSDDTERQRILADAGRRAWLVR